MKKVLGTSLVVLAFTLALSPIILYTIMLITGWKK